VAKPRPEKKRAPQAAADTRILPMQLQVGDRLSDETGDWEVIGHPYTTNMGKIAHVRVRRVDQPDVTEMRTWSAHEHISVRRG
jgi:hypothetical protein